MVMVTVVDCSAPHLAGAYLRVAIRSTALSGTANAVQCRVGAVCRPAGPIPAAVTYLIGSDQDRTSSSRHPEHGHLPAAERPEITQ